MDVKLDELVTNMMHSELEWIWNFSGAIDMLRSVIVFISSKEIFRKSFCINHIFTPVCEIILEHMKNNESSFSGSIIEDVEEILKKQDKNSHMLDSNHKHGVRGIIRFSIVWRPVEETIGLKISVSEANLPRDAACYGRCGRKLLQNTLNTYRLYCWALLVLAYKSHPLHEATLLLDKPKICEILEAGENVNERSKTGFTALHIAVLSSHAEMVAGLIKHGADVNAKDSLGWTPLMLATLMRDEDMVCQLLICGADPRITDLDNVTPFGAAEDMGFDELLRMLKEATKMENKKSRERVLTKWYEMYERYRDVL